MKIRNGFVTNSSSSSYTCAVCNATVSGMDVDFIEYELAECGTCGNVICESHVEGDLEPTYDRFREYSKDQAEYYLTMAKEKNDADYLEWGQDHLKESKMTDDEIENSGCMEDFVYEFRHAIPSDMCPLCTMREVSDEMMIKHIEMSLGTRKEIKEQVKRLYKNKKELEDRYSKQFPKEEKE